VTTERAKKVSEGGRKREGETESERESRAEEEEKESGGPPNEIQSQSCISTKDTSDYLRFCQVGAKLKNLIFIII
jgi:hypothetical protein